MSKHEEPLQESPKFRFWKSQMEANGIKINGINDFYIRRRHNGEVLFAMLEVDADTPEGDKIPPALFLKGHAVSMMVCLIDKDTRQKFVVLVKQRRIADGSQTYEHPAGMVDLDGRARSSTQSQPEQHRCARQSKSAVLGCPAAHRDC